MAGAALAGRPLFARAFAGKDDCPEFANIWNSDRNSHARASAENPKTVLNILQTRSWTTEIIFYYQVIDWNTFSEFQTGKNHEKHVSLVTPGAGAPNTSENDQDCADNDATLTDNCWGLLRSPSLPSICRSMSMRLTAIVQGQPHRESLESGRAPDSSFSAFQNAPGRSQPEPAPLWISPLLRPKLRLETAYAWSPDVRDVGLDL